MALVTVVCAAKNAAPFLGETIASVRAQTLHDWELVIVDDGSQDDTAAIVERAAADDHRISLVSLAESVGPYAAANKAMLTCSSEYLARLDADDLSTPDRLAVQIAALDADRSAAACASAWQALRPGGLDPRVMRAPSRHNGALKWMLWQRNGLPHSSLVIRTDCFVELGGYGPERVAEDYRLWTKLARSDRIHVRDEPLIHYRVWPGQITAGADARDDPARVRIQLEHIRACDGDKWTEADARDFKYLGRHADYSLSRALSLLDGWERAWRSDDSLHATERQELAGYAAYRRAGHVRHAAKRYPVEAIVKAPGVARALYRTLRTPKEELARWR